MPTSSPVVLELSFDLQGNQTSAVIRQIIVPPDQKPQPRRQQTCRACLRQCDADSTTPMRHIFQASSHLDVPMGKTLADLIEQCASIQTIIRDDSTPQHLCRKCYSQLHIAIQFKLQCERSDRQFRTVGLPAERDDTETMRIKRETNEYLDRIQCDDDETETDADSCSAVQLIDENLTKDTTAAAVGTTASRTLRTRRRPRPNLKCLQCDVVFSKHDTLKVHMRTHTGERPYVCDICHSAFKTYSAITAHVTTHSSDRPYACAQCPFRTKTRDNLRVHERIHDPVRTYACRYCDERFKTNSNMHKHERSKHGKPGKEGGGGKERRRFVCDQCDHTFASNDSLRRHRVRHTGAKPYVCPVCHRPYGWHTGLRQHMQRHHVGVEVPVDLAFTETSAPPSPSGGQLMALDEVGEE